MQDRVKRYQSSLMTPPSNRFPTTSGTLLGKLQSADDGIRYEGVASFGKVYGPVLFGFARSQGMGVEDAEDLIQDFMVRVMEEGLLDRFDRSNGSRLSSWLMKVLTNQARKEHTARTALKRGGNAVHLDFDTLDADLEYHRMPHLAASAPEVRFDLATARRLWSMAVVKLRNRYAQRTLAALVTELEPLVLLSRWPPAPALSQSEMAAIYGLSAVKLKAFFNHTLKGQARAHFIEEAKAASPGITDEDIKHLWELLCAHS